MNHQDLSIHTQLTVNISGLPQGLYVKNIKGREALGQDFSYIIEVEAQNTRRSIPINTLEAPGKIVCLQISCLQGTRYIHGYIQHMEELDHGRYSFELVSALLFLKNRHNHRSFQNQTLADIIDTLMHEHPISHRICPSIKQFPRIPYVVQYQESDDHFLHRLCELYGVYYRIEHSDSDHVLYFMHEDTHPEQMRAYRMLQRRGEDTKTLIESQRIVSNRHHHRHYDPEQSLWIIQHEHDHQGVHVNALEQHHYHGTRDWMSTPHDQITQHLAKVQAQKSASSAFDHQIHGSHLGLSVGYTCQIEGMDEPVVITWQNLELRQGPRQDFFYHHESGLLPGSVPFRLQEHHRPPTLSGVHHALVSGPSTEEIHTNIRGDIKAHFYWDRYSKVDEDSSPWLRVSYPWAGQNYGMIQIPRIGQEVWVSHVQGCPDQPMVVGTAYHPHQQHPWNPQEHPTQTGIETRSTPQGGKRTANMLRFDDKKHHEQVYLHAERNLDIEVEHDERHWVGRDRYKTIDRDETIQIGHDRNEQIGQDESIHVEGDRSHTIGQNQTTHIGHNRHFRVVGNSHQRIGGMHMRSIHGAHVHFVGGAYTQTIGVHHDVSVGMDWNEYALVNRQDHVHGQWTVHCGLHDHLMAKRRVKIVAQESIMLKVGNSSLTLTPQGMVFNSALVGMHGTLVDVKAAQMDMNDPVPDPKTRHAFEVNVDASDLVEKGIAFDKTQSQKVFAFEPGQQEVNLQGTLSEDTHQSPSIGTDTAKKVGVALSQDKTEGSYILKDWLDPEAPSDGMLPLHSLQMAWRMDMDDQLPAVGVKYRVRLVGGDGQEVSSIEGKSDSGGFTESLPLNIEHQEGCLIVEVQNPNNPEQSISSVIRHPFNGLDEEHGWLSESSGTGILCCVLQAPLWEDAKSITA
jgi:type VI secretion system secreted protein VgrG